MAKLVARVYLLSCHCGKKKRLTVETVIGCDELRMLQADAREQGWKAGCLFLEKGPNDLCPKHNPDKRSS